MVRVTRRRMVGRVGAVAGLVAAPLEGLVVGLSCGMGLMIGAGVFGIGADTEWLSATTSYPKFFANLRVRSSSAVAVLGDQAMLRSYSIVGVMLEELVVTRVIERPFRPDLVLGVFGRVLVHVRVVL